MIEVFLKSTAVSKRTHCITVSVDSRTGSVFDFATMSIGVEGREPENAHNTSNMSDPESTQKPMAMSGQKSGNSSFIEMQKPDGSAKSIDDMESAHGPSNTSVKKRSTIQKIKDFHTKRRSERFYRFLNHDLPMGIKVVGGMCVLFHWMYSLTLEWYRQSCGQHNSDWLRVSDAIMRVGVNTVFVYLVCAPAKFPEVWHAAGYAFLWLSFVSNSYVDALRFMTVAIGMVCLGLAVALLGRELWLYMHAPEVYTAFVRNSSLVDDRGKILFYKNIKAALLDAGLQEVDDFKLNVFLAEMGILTDAVTVTEEISLYFDQFMDLHDNYKAFIEENPAALATPGDTGILIAQPGATQQSYEADSYLHEGEYPEPPPPQSPLEQQFILNSTQRRIPEGDPNSSGSGANLEEIEIQEAGAPSPEGEGRNTTYGAQTDGVDKNQSIQIDEDSPVKKD